MRDVEVTAQGLDVRNCMHCDVTHFVVWPLVTIYPGAGRITAMWPCPDTGQKTRAAITAFVQALAHSDGADVVDLEWTAADDLLVKAEVQAK